MQKVWTLEGKRRDFFFDELIWSGKDPWGPPQGRSVWAEHTSKGEKRKLGLLSVPARLGLVMKLPSASVSFRVEWGPLVGGTAREGCAKTGERKTRRNAEDRGLVEWG